jgi:hypothetical protein
MSQTFVSSPPSQKKKKKRNNQSLHKSQSIPKLFNQYTAKTYPEENVPISHGFDQSTESSWYPLEKKMAAVRAGSGSDDQTLQ